MIEQIANCVAGVTGRFSLDIALAVSPRQRHLAVLHHGQRGTWHFPVRHGIGGEAIEFGNE